MSFRQKLKTDVKFRIKVVVIAILLILFYNGFVDKKQATLQSQAVCDQANAEVDNLLSKYCDLPTAIKGYYGGKSECMTYGALGLSPFPSDEAMTQCISQLSCRVARYARSGTDTYVCSSCVPDGMKTTNPDFCCNTNDEIVYKDGYDYTCKAWPPGTTQDEIAATKCNKNEESIAKIIDSFGVKGMQCKTKYMLVLFGGGFLIVILLAVAL